MAEATTVPAISIHSLRVEGDAEGADMKNKKESISIHSLRVEGDFTVNVCLALVRISIHSLRVEGDNIWSGTG